MVYMSFPSHMTDEEELLIKKYALLKKKKRQLQSLRAQQKIDPKKEEEKEKAQKRSSEYAANATEQAKKLLKAGAIKVGNDKKENTGFKRSKRQKDTEKSAVPVGYQPFSAQDVAPRKSSTSRTRHHSSDTDKDSSSGGLSFHSPPPGTPNSPGPRPDRERARPNWKRISENFVRSSERRENGESGAEARDRSGGRDRRDRRERGGGRGGREREPLPTKGNTIYVSGHGLTEDLIKRSFSSIGTIVNVSMEADKNCGFVTFEKMQSADEAISQMNGSMMSDVQLRVSMARRQPTFQQSSDPSSSSWATIAASHSMKGSQKGGHNDARGLMVYADEDDIF